MKKSGVGQMSADSRDETLTIAVSPVPYEGT